MDSSKESGKANAEGGAEMKVKTVDIRAPAGREAEPEKEKVVVTHVLHDGKKHGPGNVEEAAGKVQSGKEAVSGDKKDE